MLIGYENPSKVYLVDYGVSRKHVASSQRSLFNVSEARTGGTALYSSLAAHFGSRMSPATDLESLGYSLVELYEGSLPWNTPPDTTPELEEHWLSCMKLSIPDEELCKHMGHGMKYFFSHVSSCIFSGEPNYNLLCKHLRRELKRKQLKEDGVF